LQLPQHPLHPLHPSRTSFLMPASLGPSVLDAGLVEPVRS